MRAVSALTLILHLFSMPFQQAFAGPDAAGDPVLAAAMKGTAVPGMGMAVIRDDKLARSAVRGVRNIATKAPVQTGDLWLIGSNTKPMTAALILRLVEQGRLSLDAPLSKAYPALAAAARPEYRSITLRQMLSHTAGLPHDYRDVEKVMDSFGGGLSLPVQRVAYLKLALTDLPPLAARQDVSLQQHRLHSGRGDRRTRHRTFL